LKVSVESTDQAAGTARGAPDAIDQIRRWRSPLVVLALGGLSFALVSGSVLLFFGSFVESRDYWGLTHWLLAMVGLLPYALYQLRHYLRVRQYVQQTHYRVGLHSFYMICGTVLTGLALLLPLAVGGTAYTVMDLAHMFFGFVFTLLVSAHLTLVALLTVSRAPEAEKSRARASVGWLAGAVGVLTIAVLVASIAVA
jgi:phosphotransferase system  glucose/maltose/N-acetylglucosamine-specific IIC component